MKSSTPSSTEFLSVIISTVLNAASSSWFTLIRTPTDTPRMPFRYWVIRVGGEKSHVWCPNLTTLLTMSTTTIIPHKDSMHPITAARLLLSRRYLHSGSLGAFYAFCDSTDSKTPWDQVWFRNNRLLRSGESGATPRQTLSWLLPTERASSKKQLPNTTQLWVILSLFISNQFRKNINFFF